jgi:hypothetical protein
VPHHHAAGIARQTLGRSRRNARAAFEHRLARCVGIGQHLGIDVNDDLVPLARRARIDPMVQSRLGHYCQGVGPAAAPWWAPPASRRRKTFQRERLFLPTPIEQISRRRQRPHDDRAALRFQPPPDHHHAVGILINVQRPMPVPTPRLLRLGLPIHSSPPADDEFDVLGRAGTASREQPLFGLRRGDPGQRADLGVRQLTARECL